MLRTPIALAFIVLLPAPAPAQPAPEMPAMSSHQLALACAPPPELAGGRRQALRVVGAQDTVARGVFDDHDLLIVRGGTSTGVSVGQRYFVRRPVAAPNYSNRLGLRHPIHTGGWVRIVATNDGTSIALVEHACGAINSGDYLEPFAMPAAPSDAGPAGSPADLDFGATGRVMFGDDERSVAGPGEFLVIDRGTDRGLSAGARFAVYRDVQAFRPEAGRMRSAGLPLAAIGEGVVVASGPSTSVAQLVSARDAVRAGDVVVPRRQ